MESNQQTKWPRVILHVDGDAFFASCEQAMHPELRGKPVVTGQERGIISSASYEAKAFGIKRGVPLWQVKALCPHAVIVSSDYHCYRAFSERMYEIIRRYTWKVEEYSIDEAFADISGLEHLFGSPETLGRRIKNEIESELGISVSVGVSVTKVLAKVGSKWNKPSGFTLIEPQLIEHFLSHLPLEKVWGIGRATARRCQEFGMTTALDFARQPFGLLRDRFPAPVQDLWRELNGEAALSLNPHPKTTYASISKMRTFHPPSSKRSVLLAQLMNNLENACAKARHYGLAAQGIAITLRRQDFRFVGDDVRLTRPSSFPIEMAQPIRKMFDQIFSPGVLYRATSVTLTGLLPADGCQISLFESPKRQEKVTRLYAAMDALAKRHGRGCLKSAGSLAAHEQLVKDDAGWN